MVGKLNSRIKISNAKLYFFLFNYISAHMILKQLFFSGPQEIFDFMCNSKANGGPQTSHVSMIFCLEYVIVSGYIKLNRYNK